MRISENLRGTGFIVRQNERIAANYGLTIRQKEIRVETMAGRSSTALGLKQIDGWVTPFVGSLGETLALELSDGSVMPFFFRNPDGLVAASGEIHPPALTR